MNFQDGDRVLEYIKDSPSPKARLEFQVTHLRAKPAPKVTSYSSRGPSQSCPFILKPDLIAPGALILASWPQKLLVTKINSRDNNAATPLAIGAGHINPNKALDPGLIYDVTPQDYIISSVV